MDKVWGQVDQGDIYEMLEYLEFYHNKIYLDDIADLIYAKFMECKPKKFEYRVNNNE